MNERDESKPAALVRILGIRDVHVHLQCFFSPFALLLLSKSLPLKMKQSLKQAVVFHAFYPFCLLKDLDPSISIFWDNSSKLCQFGSQCVEISVSTKCRFFLIACI